MSYTFLLEQAVESSVESFADIPASVLSKLNLTAKGFSFNGSGTESCPGSQSGTTSKHSTQHHGEGGLILSAEDSHVRTSRSQTQTQRESTETDLVFGKKWQESFAKYDQSTHSWKTRQLWLLEDLEESLQIWPKWGCMQHGECWELGTLEPIIEGNESGYLPTPTASDYKGGSSSEKRFRERGAKSNLRDWCAFNCNAQYPPVASVESLMEWPIGWTDLKLLEMDKYQLWQQQHLKSLNQD